MLQKSSEWLGHRGGSSHMCMGCEHVCTQVCKPWPTLLLTHPAHVQATLCRLGCTEPIPGIAEAAHHLSARMDRLFQAWSRPLRQNACKILHASVIEGMDASHCHSQTLLCAQHTPISAMRDALQWMHCTQGTGAYGTARKTDTGCAPKER